MADANKNTANYENEIAGLKKDIDTLKGELRDAAAAGGDALGNAREILEKEAHKLMERVTEAASGARKQSEEVLHNVEEHIGEKPLQSVLMTLGIGFVVGWLVGRR